MTDVGKECLKWAIVEYERWFFLKQNRGAV